MKIKQLFFLSLALSVSDITVRDYFHRLVVNVASDFCTALKNRNSPGLGEKNWDAAFGPTLVVDLLLCFRSPSCCTTQFQLKVLINISGAQRRPQVPGTGGCRASPGHQPSQNSLWWYAKIMANHHFTRQLKDTFLKIYVVKTKLCWEIYKYIYYFILQNKLASCNPSKQAVIVYCAT